jgi:hypothetical protein
MKTRSVRLATCFSFFALMVSCNSQNLVNPGAPYCAQGYHTRSVPIDVANNGEKTKLEDSTEPQLPPGEYVLGESDVFIDDPGRQIRMHVRMVPQKNSSAVTLSLMCIGGNLSSNSPDVGVSLNMKPFSFQIPYLALVKVDDNGKTLLQRGQFTVELRPKTGAPWLIATHDQNKDTESGSIKDTFGKATDLTQFLYKLPGNGLEVRSSFKAESDIFVSWQKLSRSVPSPSPTP